MIPNARLILLLIASLALVACGDDAPGEPKGPGKRIYLEEGRWLMIEPPGRVCSNGSRYRFFVNLNHWSDDLLVVLEPGGACWDYESCSGSMGIRGAANPNGIEPDHMVRWEAIVPLLHTNGLDYDDGKSYPPPPTASYNKIFIPYCTGDIHAGNNVVDYPNPNDPSKPLKFHHKGHENVASVIEWINEHFNANLDTLFVTGCSAGGVGSLANYYFIRNGVGDVRRGVMLDDAGPIFPNSPYSKPLHAKVRESWNVDSIFSLLPEEIEERLLEDFGNINAMLAEEFPEDRLANVYFRMDYNFTLYSYERFHEDTVLEGLLPKSEDYRREIYRMWWEDTRELLAMSDDYDNLGYYIPFFRPQNDSHCATIIGWKGTEIEEENLDLYDYIDDLLHGEGPVGKYVESTPDPGEFSHLAPSDPWP